MHNHTTIRSAPPLSPPAEREASAHLFNVLGSAIPAEYTLDDYLAERRTLQDARWATVALLPGAARLVQHLHAHGVPLCLATGSMRRNVLAKTHGHAVRAVRDVFACFEGRSVCGDDAPCVRRCVSGGLRDDDDDDAERVGGNVGGVENVEKGTLWAEPMRGKPHPDVFLRAAGEVLGRDVGVGHVDESEGVVSEAQRLERAKGLVFEDGVPGVRGALAGGFNGEYYYYIPTLCGLVVLTKKEIFFFSGLGTG